MSLISNDLLRSYDDVSGFDPFNGRRSDPSAMNFHESRMRRPIVSVFELEDEYPTQEIVSVVDKCMKKYVDKLLWHIEGISGRLSQLEIHCYKLERSIGEFRADTLHDQSEVDTKLKSLEKNLEKVTGSIQILRDKQELSETHGELTKLQSTPKDSDTRNRSHKCEETTAPSLVSEPTRHNNVPGIPDPHSARALPSHERYVLHRSAPVHPQQSQALQPEIHYIQVCTTPQIQDASIQPPSTPPRQPQAVIQNQPPPPFPQYSQHFTQLPPQTLMVRPQTPPTYTLYASQPTNQHHVTAEPHQPLSHVPVYSTVYSIDGSRVHGLQTHQPMHPNPNPNTMGSHPCGDVIEKAVSMGYPREQVVGAVNRMAESGQPVDFNAVLDRMNSRPQAWSG